MCLIGSQNSIPVSSKDKWYKYLKCKAVRAKVNILRIKSKD